MKAYLKRELSKIKMLSPLRYKIFAFKRDLITKAHVDKLRNLESKTEKEIVKIQKEKLHEILNYAYDNTVYYKKVFDKLGINRTDINELKRIPFLTKEIIKENKHDLLSSEYRFESLGHRNTGGSTGQPLEFFCDSKCGLIDNAHHFYQYSLMGYKKGDLILGSGAVVISEEERNKHIYWAKIGKAEAFGDYKLSILYLTKDNIKYYVAKLLDLKPAILRGYPSLFDSLAQHILENNIIIDFHIKGISLTSEMCSEIQKNNIEKAFNSRIYFEYGHTEVAVLCSTCDDTYIYKSAPTYGYVEVLNNDGSETQIGEAGNIVVTGFNNKGMPFIRYRTEDIGELAYKNLGIVHFSKIIGRSQDFIHSSDNQKISISALTSWQHFTAFANISKWQIIQNQLGVIDILIIRGKNFSKVDEQEINDKIKKIIRIEIVFKYVDYIPRTNGGKHLFLIQNVKNR